MQSYTTWFIHGEQMAPVTAQAPNAPINREPIHEGSSGMQALLHDVFSMHIRVNKGGSQIGVEAEDVHLNEKARIGKTKKFFNLLKELEELLWSGCTSHIIFSAIVGLFNLKCESGWSNTSFSKFLGFLKGIVTSNAKLPKDTYGAKKYMKELGLGYENIQACRNGCTLFWKDNEKLERYTKGNASKWKQTMSVDDDSSQKSKSKLANVLPWLPLIPKSQRLFM